jgi:hypothetical protein
MTAPKRLLTQNSEMRRDAIWNWTLPAWVTTLSDGTSMNVCPAAGACAKVCYARNGTYRFPTVRAAHLRNLELTLHDRAGWQDRMLRELRNLRPIEGRRLPDVPRDHLDPHAAALLDTGAPAVRIHDSGDFYADDYLVSWLTIATLTPGVLFYAYTKGVDRMRRVATHPPSNFLWVYSLGGREDHLLDLDVDRHADVFPTLEELDAAGYTSQDTNDLLSVVHPSHRIGIPANNIPAYRKTLTGHTFRTLEEETPRRRRDLPVVTRDDLGITEAYVADGRIPHPSTLGPAPDTPLPETRGDR